MSLKSTPAKLQLMIDRKWNGRKKDVQEKEKDGFHGMRPWQKKAFSLLKNSDFCSINAPMGSGKSWMICLLSAYKMQGDLNLRTLIAVPQSVIGNGFKKTDILMPGNRKLRWEPMHWLCDNDATRPNTDYVIAWLKRKPTELNDRVVVCTHATLLNVYKELRETKQLRLLKNLLLWVDEAHHVRNTNIEEGKKAVASNGIGGIVAHAVKPTSGMKLGLATATFFRGDRCTLVTDQMAPLFKRFNLTFDEHLGDMKHLRSFSYKFLMCGPDYPKALPNIFCEHKGKSIVFIPQPNSKHSTGCKYEEVDAIIDAFKKAYGGRRKDDDGTDGVLTTLTGKDGPFRILDMVDEDKRDEKKAFTRHINENHDELDAIVALGMCKEGFDWVHADRVIIVGSRGSLVDVVQTIGRLFRDVEGKRHVEVIHMLPFEMQQLDKEKYRENLNDYLKAVYAAMILENMIDPIKIKGPNVKRPPQPKIVGGNNDDYLGAMIPDESERLDVLQNAAANIIGVRVGAEEEGVKPTRDQYREAVKSTLVDYDVPESHRDQLSDYILAMFSRVSARRIGLDVRKIHYNVITKHDPIDGLFDFVTQDWGVQTWREFRDVVKASDPMMTFEELKQQIAEMRKKGQTFRSIDEYREWARTGMDFNRVLQMREAI